MTKREPSRTPASGKRLPAQVRQAVQAARDRLAADPVVLDLRPAHGFTDYFVICSGRNVRQIKAIADAVQVDLEKLRVRPAVVEGYDRADWVLLDYFDFIVHVFNPDTRAFYALERLWGNAERVDLPPEERPGSVPEPK
jgi:ribosome-associated protein